MYKRDQRFPATIATLAPTMALALLATAPIGGCQAVRRVHDSTTQREGRSPLDSLRAKADAERAQPSPVDIDPRFLPGLDAAAVAPLSPSELASGAPARVSLRELLESAELLPPPVHGDAPNDDARLTAQLRYAQGRQRLLSGQAEEAIADLQSATRLDPTAAELWRELGQAQSATGRRTSAAASYRKAVELGMRDPQVLFVLARDLARSNKADEARTLLLEAARSDFSAADPGMAPLVHAELAPMLARTGHYTAAREAMMISADLHELFAAATNMRNEVAELYRNRGEAWQQIGDWSSRLRDANAALEAYAKAGTFPGVDLDGLSTRRLVALLSAGRPAAAALLLLDQVSRTDDCVSQNSIALAQQLRASTDLGPHVADAIALTLREIGTSLTPSQRLALARVEAALQPAEAARREQVGALALDADPTSVLHDLVGSLPRDVAVRASLASEIADAVPRLAPALAEALLLDGVGIDAFLDVASKRSGTVIVQGYMLAKLGRPDSALARVEGSVDVHGDARVPALLAKAEFAVSSAKWDVLDQSLASLSMESSPGGKLAYATALRAALRPGPAIDALDGDDRLQQSSSFQLLRADLGLRLGKAQEAERSFQRLLESDRFDERAYEGLITLHLPTGAMPDADKLSTSLRLLREAIPQGRVAQFLVLRNMLARGQRERAESVLVDMVRHDPPNAIALELLTAMWEAPARDSKSAPPSRERFLRELVDRHPDSPQILASLARVLAVSGKELEAESVLSTAISKHPIPTLARLREHIIRDIIKDVARADQLTLDRLDHAAPTVDTLVERADFEARRGDLPAAARVLARGLPRDVTLTTEQHTLLLNILTKAPLDAKTSRDQALAMVHLFQRVPEQQLIPVLQIKRLTAAAIAYANEPGTLASEVQRLAKAQPDIGISAFRPVLQILESIGERQSSIAFLHELLIRSGADWSEDLGDAYVLFIAIAGSAGDAEALIRLAPDRPSLVRWLAVIHKRLRSLDSLEPGVSESFMRAELAYTLASAMGSAGREAESEATLALAIKLDSSHAMANNDLGYNLADRGERLDEAEKMLERALEGAPGNANVLDSMAWLRYKRGQLRDETGVEGAVTREGAITLLRRALSLDEDGDNAIMRDHLGDALWRDGQRDQAIQIWREASAMIAPTIAILADRKEDPSLTAKVIRQVAESLRSKLAAAQANIEPTIAPLAASTPAPQGAVNAEHAEPTPK